MTPLVRALPLVCFVFAACSLLDVPALPDCEREGRPDRCACVDTRDCERFSDMCTVYVCGESGLCQAQVRDDDADGDPPMACPEGGDCDDRDPLRSSRAPELCDGIDNDCNGLLDGPDEDRDQDGVASCASDGRPVDCDDEAPETYPGAPELCDGIDNDCVVDGVVRITGGRVPAPEEDRDGDGHSARDAPCLSEGAPNLFPADDCDDDDRARFPGAFEACDGIDNDCDGIADGTPDDATPGAACVPQGLAVGARHACALRRDGRVVCWGTSREGERAEAVSGLEIPEGLSASIPLDDQVEIVAGRAFTCARSRGGEVSCWGSCAMEPGAFVFGIDDVGSERPRCLRTFRGGIVTDATQLTAGRDHACALRDDGRVVCWGARPLDLETDVCGPDAQLMLALAPHEVVDAAGLTGLSAGGQQTCGLRDGKVFCFPFREDPPVREVAGLDHVQQVSCAGRECCALDAERRVFCWGPEPRDDLIPAPGTSCIRDPGIHLRLVATGVVRVWSSHAALEQSECQEFLCAEGARRPDRFVAPRTTHCFELEGGQVSCLSVLSAAVGNGAQGSASALVPLAGVTAPRALGLGLDFGCALDESGVRCWGKAGAGMRGDGVIAWWNRDPLFDVAEARPVVPEPCTRTFGESRTCPLLEAEQEPRTPVTTSLFAHPVQIATGGLSTCVRAVDGRAACARSIGGPYTTGFLALGSEIRDLEVSGDELVSLSPGAIGYETTCALDLRGRAACSEVVRPRLVLLQPQEALLARHDVTFTDPSAIDIEVSQTQIFVRDERGSIRASTRRGLNQDFPSDLTFSPVPDARTGQPLEGIVAFDCGRDHCCGRDAAGSVVCWGDGGPELGHVPSRPEPAAQRVPLAGPARSVTASGDRSCAVLHDGSTWCWGAAFPAEGAQAGGLAPRLLGQGALSVALGDGHACILLGSGEVRCLGQNDSGQLGVGGVGYDCESTAALIEFDLLSPVAFPLPDPIETSSLRTVKGIDDARVLACGGDTCCAGRESGQVVCWGRNACNLGGPVVWTSFEPTPLVAPFGGLGVGIAYPDMLLSPLPALE